MGKAKKAKARIPRGFRDIFVDELTARQGMIEAITDVYRLHGFLPIETPAVEYVETLGKFLPESETPEGGIFAFRDDSEEWVALRYDLTAPLSRFVVEHEPDLPFPFRRYQVGPVYRLEKPGPGRFREFHQCDFDIVGASSMAADAEICIVLSRALDSVIPSGDFIIKVNNRKVLNGVLETAGLGVENVSLDEISLTVLRAIDKLDRIELDGVIQLLGKGRKDESGDFTKGANLEADQIDYVKRYLQVSGGRKVVCDGLAELVGDSKIGLEGVAELREVDELLHAAGFGEAKVIFDPTIVRGLGYYTGPVYEAVLTFEVIDEQTGAKKQFGSVAGGGRYDDLVSRFPTNPKAATGASIGVDRLLSALEYLGSYSRVPVPPPVLVTVMDKKRLSDYQVMLEKLRRAEIPAEMYLGKKNIKNQMKYADQRGCPIAVIAGEDEFSQGVVSIKDLRLGKLKTEAIEDREEWRSGEGIQITIASENLIECVGEMLEMFKEKTFEVYDINTLQEKYGK